MSIYDQFNESFFSHNTNKEAEKSETAEDWSNYFHCCEPGCCPVCYWGPPAQKIPACGCPHCPPPPPILPHAFLYDTTTQIAFSKKPKLITFNRNSLSNKILHTTSCGKITFTAPGVYAIALTASIEKTSNEAVELQIWLRKNGLDASFSSRKAEICLANHIETLSTSYMLELHANHYIEFYQLASRPDTGAGLYSCNQIMGPSVPSVAVSIRFVSP